MPAEALEQAQIGPEQVVDGGLVRLGDVVVLQEGVDGQLPVHRPADVLRIEDHVLVDGEAVEVGQYLFAEESLHIQRRPRRMPRPDGAETFGYGHLGEVQAGAVDAIEAVAMGNATQLAVRVVGPGMVGTDEDPVASGRIAHQLGAAVLADVQEAAQAPPFVAGQQQRRQQVEGDEVAGRDLAGTRHQQRLAAQDLVPFAAITLRVQISLHRQGRGRLDAIGDALFHQGQGSLEQFHLGRVLHGHLFLLSGRLEWRQGTTDEMPELARQLLRRRPW
ncbi:hypothetical protein D3C84_569100 [compost metagenome]